MTDTTIDTKPNEQPPVDQQTAPPGNQAAPTDAEKAAQAALDASGAAAESWAATGDTFVDTLATGYVSAGGSVEQFQALLSDVAASGTLTEAAKVELRAKFGPMAEALIPSIEQKAAQSKQWADRERKAVYDAVGGQSKFAEMQAWAKENLTEDVRGFLTSALEKGGKSAQLALKQLKELMIEGGATVTGENFKPGATAQGEGESLTRQAYLNERIKLERTGDKAGVEALQARARAAIDSATRRGVRW